ncbi:hypothetical protein BUALT_Bualt01G0210400 [Buddleja alternifolia]|uniref:Uncharacterized protein n=1 Tax=Buddleja alternifolia TaxID=168488 RepID=A0AAV6YJB5_9LAMI|nr:hypothetical protein BUALT_Bualt01G0210400 [Buddleja alternifolia]
MPISISRKLSLQRSKDASEFSTPLIRWISRTKNQKKSKSKELRLDYKAYYRRDKENYPHLKSTILVHVDDVARAHIHLFEYAEAKGRYICTAVKVTIEGLCEFISARYPEYHMSTPDSCKDLVAPIKLGRFVMYILMIME